MGKVSDIAGYEHYVPECPLDPSFPAAYERILIRSLRELKTLLEQAPRGVVAFDIETNGLSPAEHFIVGVSLCFDRQRAYYIPIRHATGVSLGPRALDWVYRYLRVCSCVLVYNLRFDFRFMEWADYDMSQIEYRDVAVPTFLSDTNVRAPSLKWAQRHFLGWPVSTFEETLGDNPNFYHVDPETACLAAETLVDTDHGLLRIQEMQTRLLAGQQLSVVTPRGLRPVRAVVSKGVQPTVQVLYGPQGLRSKHATPDHLFLVSDGVTVRWKAAGEITSAESLVLGDSIRGIDFSARDSVVPVAEIHALKTTPVRTATPVVDALVFDVVLSDTHVYLLDDGIVTHNCDYAAQDALGTFHLDAKVAPFWKESGLVAKIDNSFLYPFMKMEEETTLIDLDEIRKQELALSGELRQAEHQVYELAGQVFNVGSSMQRASVMEKLGLDTGNRTAKTNMMMTGHKELERLKDKQGEWLHPILPALIEVILTKDKLKNVQTISKNAIPRDGRLRFRYMTTSVPTGRLACGGAAKDTFFAGINVQAQTKPKAIDYYCKYVGEDTDDPEHCILGWQFSTDPEFSDLVIEGAVEYPNLRASFKPEPGHLWVSIDYSSQELRIPANLSGEPAWVKAFVNGDDVHAATAVAIWGRTDKNLRKKAKIMNFGLLYGGNGKTIYERLGVPLHEATRLADEWWGALVGLRRWSEEHKNAVRRAGVAYTYFGRPRRMAFFFAHPTSGMRAFGYRTAINTVVQGAAADIIKIALTRCWPILRDSDEAIAFRSTVHDEINFTCRKDYVLAAVPQLVKAMAIRLKGWPVPMEVEVSLGTSWGWLFPFRLLSDGTLEPSYDRKA